MECIDVTFNAVECVVTMCVSFRYSLCRCYEHSVQLILFYVRQMGCVCCYLVFSSCNVLNIVYQYTYCSYVDSFTDFVYVVFF
jgi:hypothetical protein